MHARSALFDVYGDHLLARGGSAPVAALIRLLAPLQVRAPAVRTAISRMVAQDWLVPVDTAAGPGYRVSERARRRLVLAGDRIYRTSEAAWDRQWHLRVLAPIADRGRRERIRSQLRFLGMAPISDSTWVSPRANQEVAGLLADEAVESVALTSTDVAPVETLLDAFHIATLAGAYQHWLDEAERLVGSTPTDADDRAAFVVRSQLVHGWRKFLFTDPGLPRELLPPDWPGNRAGVFFNQQARNLMPLAARFVDACLDPERTGANR